MIVGVDLFLLFNMQFKVIEYFIGKYLVFYLLIGIEQLFKVMCCFDMVFLMGVLYYCRFLFDYLIELWDLLWLGGELVLEILVIEGDVGQMLVLDGCYVWMGNVWFILLVLILIQWMYKVCFK